MVVANQKKMMPGISTKRSRHVIILSTSSLFLLPRTKAKLSASFHDYQYPIDTVATIIVFDEHFFVTRRARIKGCCVGVYIMYHMYLKEEMAEPK